MRARPLLALLIATYACSRPAAAPPSAAEPAAEAPVAASSSSADAALAGAAVPLLTSSDVDALLAAEWTRAGVAAAPTVDDATFLRRVTVDVAGTIPRAEDVTAFLVDRAPDKRTRAVEAALASPEYVAHWTDYWDDVLMGTPRGQDVDRDAFRAWLHDEIAADTPWNRFVYDLLTASGQNSAGGPRREARARAETRTDPETGVRINGAVNFTLQYQEAPQDLAGMASRTFLGVQIQCAQCHDHKTEKWTQDDFRRFASTFLRTRIVPVDRAKTMGIRRVELEDLDRPAPRYGKSADLRPIADARPTALDGTDLAAAPNVRAALAGWMTARDRDWFARAIVNRMWGHFLGRGFVDPVDDMRPSNPTTAEPVLRALAADFVASGFDTKHLIRVITGTAVYQRTASAVDGAAAKADPDARLWERFRMTPLGPDELLRALSRATGLDTIVARAGRPDMDQLRFQLRRRYTFLFDVDEDTDRGEYDGTITQALALLNGSVVATGASSLPGSAIAEILAQPWDDAARIQSLFLRILSRPARDAEVAEVMATLDDASRPIDAAEGGSRRQGDERVRAPDPLRGLERRAAAARADARTRAFEDLAWALLNSSEFLFNH
jgi:hypothetical protein